MIISERIGYRLNMSPDMPYHKACSIQLYKGFIAKIMVLFKLAISHQFLNDKGKLESYAINIKSLGFYIFRNNWAKETNSGINYLKKMASFYFQKNKNLKESIKKPKKMMPLIISQRKFIKALPTSIPAFREVINHKAPFKGKIYKIEKANETKGYILGTSHKGNKLLANLSPKINKALEKAKIIACELQVNPFAPGDEQEKELTNEQKEKHKLESQSDEKSVSDNGLNIYEAVESHIVYNLQKHKKEWVGLEDPNRKIDEEEKIKDQKKANEFIQYLKDSKIDPWNAKQLNEFVYRVFLNNNLKFMNLYASAYHSNLSQERNLNMVNAAEEHFNKGRTFIAVGIFHLVGEKNMVELLKERGYTVTKYSRKNFKKVAAAP